MILVGIGTYKKILRPTQNPTLAGMDPLVEAIEEEVNTKDPLPSSRKITNQRDSETNKHKSINSSHFENILSP